MNNQPCITRPTLADLNPDKHNQGFSHYSSRLGRCNGSCNTLVVPSNRICISNKTEDANINVFNMITRINESKTSIKHISCDCICKFDGRKFKSNEKWRLDKSRYESKNPINHCVYKENYVWNPNICDCKINRYLKSIADDSINTCDEKIEVSDSVSINFNARMEYYHILLTFLLVVISLSITTIGYYCKKKSVKTKRHITILLTKIVLK